MTREPGLPHRLRGRPRNAGGFVVPWFVAWVDGKPDFRVIRRGGIEKAIREHLCWLCGGTLSGRLAFVIGPMCAVNRTTAEPPSHVECAVYAAQHCPFLTRPNARRRDKGLPEDHELPAGEMITRNPGVALLWIVRRYSLFPDGRGGLLIDLGEPIETRWFAQGREATRDEVLASIESGLPLLREMAESEGPAALAQLDRMVERAMPFVPAAA